MSVSEIIAGNANLTKISNNELNEFQTKLKEMNVPLTTLIKIAGKIVVRKM